MEKHTILTVLTAFFLLIASSASCENQPKELVILSSHKAPFNESFTDETGIEVKVQSYTLGIMEQISQIFVTRDEKIDIYCLPSFMGLYSIKEKEFYQSLNATAVSESIKQLYPAFSKALTAKNGDIVGWISEVQPLVRTEDSQLLRQMGIDSPKTFDQFLDASKQLVEAGALTEGYMLADTVEYSRGSMLDWYIKLYIAEAQQRDQKITFDTPVFRAMSQRIKTEVPDQPPYIVSGNMEEEADFNPIFTMNTVYDSITPFMLPMPSVFDDSAGAIETYATIMIINPFSPRIENAIRYLEYGAQWRDMNSYFFISGMDEPMENPSAAAEILKLDKSIHALEVQENTPANRDALSSLQASVRELEARRYLVSLEAIEHYQSLVPGLYVSEDSPVGYDKALRLLATQYAGGAIDIENFVEQCQRHINLIYSERGL